VAEGCGYRTHSPCISGKEGWGGGGQKHPPSHANARRRVPKCKAEGCDGYRTHPPCVSGEGGVVVVRNTHRRVQTRDGGLPSSKTSMRMLVFDGGGVVAMESNQPPSKMSTHARFRGWLDGGSGRQAATLENEQTRSFSRVTRIKYTEGLPLLVVAVVYS
jgi:hypothetical protein